MLAPDKIPAEPDEAHFQISQRAAETLGRLVDGNGLKADQVRLARHETLVHQVPGFIHVELVPDVTTHQQKGNAPRGKVVGNKEAVLQDAAGLVPGLVADAGIQDQILEHIVKDPGRGFGMKTFKLKLPSTAKEYSVVVKCTKCNGLQAYNCARCHTQGQITCVTCNGQGASACQQCFGSGQYQRGDGQRTTCTRCNGQGRMTCTGCSGQRMVRCPGCAGQGRIACTECDRSGYWTDIYELTFRADGDFVLDRQQVPQNVLDIIDHLGVRNLATQNLAQIFRVGVTPQEKLITVPLLAFLPIAQAEFTVEGKPYAAHIAGLPGVILSIPPLLDNTIKPGINALFKLSKGPMAAAALVDQACRYRLIRQALGGLAHHSKKHVFGQLQKEYPVGLSEKYAKAAVRYADMALLAMGKTPRLKGLLAGTAVAAALDGLYYFKLHDMIAGHASMKNVLATDLGVWLLGYGVAFLTIKVVAAMALKKMLPDIVKTEDRGLPAAGEQGYYALGTTLVAWLVIAYLAPATLKPIWLAHILKMAGLS